jgi:hypothetical protein
MPTIATKVPPMPKASGASMYSSRAPVPYPAISAEPNQAPTSDVVIVTVRLVCSEVIAATTPTRRISLNSAHRGRTHHRCAALRPLRIYQVKTAMPAT